MNKPIPTLFAELTAWLDTPSQRPHCLDTPRHRMAKLCGIVATLDHALRLAGDTSAPVMAAAKAIDPRIELEVRVHGHLRYSAYAQPDLIDTVVERVLAVWAEESAKFKESKKTEKN